MKNLPVWENFVAVTSPQLSNLLGDFSGSNSSPIVQETRKGFHATYTNVGMEFGFTLFRPSNISAVISR